MSWYNQRWAPYVSVAKRKEMAAKKIAQIKKKGEEVNPVVIQGRDIASTFWGKAWCKHLESYSDCDNRLPRGRSYVRNGSVIDLKIQKGEIIARVVGSSIYTVTVKVKAIVAEKWQPLVKECSGKINSLIELLQGKFSKAVMEIITHKDKGLFPHLKEIKFACSCPDYATMCKHIAAVLYGIGNRLDTQPEHLFLLRQVDQLDLIASAATTDKLTRSHGKSNKAKLAETDLSALFGIDIDESPTKPAQITRKSVRNKSSKKLPMKKAMPPKKKPTQSKKPAKTKTTKKATPKKKTKVKAKLKAA